MAAILYKLSRLGRHGSCCSSLRNHQSIRRSMTSLDDILRDVQRGILNPSEASNKITNLFNQNAQNGSSINSFAKLDHDRFVRTNFPEVVFAEGKTAPQIALILDDMARSVNEKIESSSDPLDVASTAILATRVSPELFEALSQQKIYNGVIRYHEMAKVVSVEASLLKKRQKPTDKEPPLSRVVVATAGTTDMPIAEEAAVTLEAAGCEVDRIYDAGVAGLHRIVRAIPRLTDPKVDCVIVAAGMDGALPSVVGGLVRVPVIAVPTSIGYGASFGGVSAMLTMLNSCSPGVGVVNIDNGFGAAALAYKCTRSRP